MVSLKLRSTVNGPSRHLWFAHRCNFEIVRRRILLPVALSLSERSCALLMSWRVMHMRQPSTDHQSLVVVLLRFHLWMRHSIATQAFFRRSTVTLDDWTVCV